MSIATDNNAMLARFAAVINAFDGNDGWWNRLLTLGESERHLNIKKEGIFPLVHGVRSLALAHHLFETGTVARIEALRTRGALDVELANAVTDSLHFFMELRLKAGLTERETGQSVTGNVDIEKMNSLDRDLLKDTLAVVKRFKALLRLRFHLDAF
jgi:CBS domain-containing protein